MQTSRSHAGLVWAMLCLALTACQPAGPTPGDEAAIRQLITEDFKAAWDANDEEAIAAFFTEDANLAFPTSHWIEGRAAIQQAFDWPDFSEGRTIDLQILSLRFLDGSTAVVHADASFTGGRQADYWDSAVSIMKKVDGRRRRQVAVLLGTWRRSQHHHVRCERPVPLHRPRRAGRRPE